jgi:hypothetical protein
MNWAGQAEIDGGLKEGVTSDEREETRRLRREVAEPKRTNGILRAASAFFAAELDRPQSKWRNSSTGSKRIAETAAHCGVSSRFAKRLPKNAVFRYRLRDIAHSKRAGNRQERRGIVACRTKSPGYAKRTILVMGFARYGTHS